MLNLSFLFVGYRCNMQALLEYEKHKRLTGELQLPVGSLPQSTNTEKEVDFISLSSRLLFVFNYIFCL